MAVTVGKAVELTDPAMSPVEINNLRARQEQFTVVQQLKPLAFGSGIASGTLCAGTYKGGALPAGARVFGYGYPLVQGAVQASGNCTLSGLVLSGPLVLSADCALSAIDCTFSDTVTMAAGALASFVGCRFDSNASVQNAGLATAAQITGGIKTSGITDTNVTVVGRP